MICILSPVLLILLGGLAEAGFIPMEVTIAEIGGTGILLIMIAAAVGMFIREGMRGKKYEYLEYSIFPLQFFPFPDRTL